MNMTNEMGNNNTAAVKEEDEAADEQVKTGENVDQEAQPDDFHSTRAALSSTDIITAENSLGEIRKSIAKGEVKNEYDPDSMVSESSAVLRDPASPHADIAKEASLDEAMKENSVELDLKESMPLSGSSQLDGQLCTSEEVDIGEEGRSKPSEPETREQLLEAANKTKSTQEVLHCSSSLENEQVNKPIISSHEVIRSVGNGIQLEESIEDFVKEQSRPLEERILEMNICEGKWGTENHLGNGPRNQGNSEVSGEMNIISLDSSYLSSVNDCEANPEEQDKRVTDNEGTGLFVSKELENNVEKGDLEQDDSSKKMEEHHVMINSLIPFSEPDETCCKETGEKSNVQLSSSSDTDKMCHNRSKSFLPDKIIEKHDNIEDVSLISPAITSFMTELSSTAENKEATYFNSQIENAFTLRSNAVGNTASYEIFSPAFPNDTALEISTSILPDKELAMIDQTTSGTMRETENASTRSNEQYIIGRTSSLPKGEAEEIDARVEVKSNTLRKSPSFDFGVPFVFRSEDSDQTPLLRHDKNASRSSFSGYSNIRPQNNTMQADYYRKSLDFEPVEVEEKTIRMERSDSAVSRVSSLMKRDADVNVEHVLQKQESRVADQKETEIKAEELALSNQKRRGKRKTGTSIFSTCVCCIAEFD